MEKQTKKIKLTAQKTDEWLYVVYVCEFDFLLWVVIILDDK